MCGCLWSTPYWGPGPQPNMCSDWESNWRPFGLQACAQSSELHQPRWTYSYYRQLNTTAEVYALKKWQVCQTCLPLSRFTPQWQLLLIIKCLSFPSTLENFFNLKKIITSKEQGPCLHVFLFLHWTSCTETSLKTFVSFCRGILYKKCLFWFLGQWSAERISIGRCFND